MSCSTPPEPLKKVFSWVDDNKEKLIATLGEAIEIKSVSAWPDHREVSFNITSLPAAVDAVGRF